MSAPTLDHETPECVGHWRKVEVFGAPMICCDRCNARRPPTPENHLAAINENYAGIYLRRMTAEGASILEAERAS